MKHPSQQELISLLYGEIPAGSNIEAHLQACAECRGQVAAWRQTASGLNAWSSALKPRRARFPQVFQYAAAAAVVLGLGFLGGRLSSPGTDVRAVRAECQALVAEAVAKASAQNLQNLQALNDGIENRLKAVQVQNAADYSTLRKELETVAVLTQASLQRAQAQIVQLANYTPQP